MHPETCTEEQWASVLDGSAVVRDWFVVGVEGHAVDDAEMVDAEEGEDSGREWEYDGEGQRVLGMEQVEL